MRVCGALTAQRQKEEPGRQPRGRGPLPWSLIADKAEAPVEEPPMDLLDQQHQRMSHVDDLIQRRSEKILLSSSRGLLIALPHAGKPGARNHDRAQRGISNRRNSTHKRRFLAVWIISIVPIRLPQQWVASSSRTITMPIQSTRREIYGSMILLRTA